MIATDSTRRDWVRLAGTLFIAGLAVLFVVLLVQSFDWRMEHDTPLMHYISYLVLEHGRVPYRDIFDMNFPGTVLAHLLVARTLGYNDRAIVIANLVATALMLLLGARLLRPFGWRAALTGPLLFGCLYFGYGPTFMLEREVLLLVPCLAALGCVVTRWRWRPVGDLLAGLFMGCASTIKPQSLLLLPILLGYSLWHMTNELPADRRRGRWWSVLLFAAIGFVLPWLGIAAWLASCGALGDFLSIARNYDPLYGSLSGTAVTMTLPQRIEEMLRVGRVLYGRAVWLAPALLGSYLAFRAAGTAAAERARLRLVVVALFFFLAYPFISAQFWVYHLLPFLCFASLLAGLCLAPHRATGPPLGAAAPAAEDSAAQPSGAAAPNLLQPGRWLPLLSTALALFLTLNVSFTSQAQFLGRPPPPPKEGRVDAIAAYLRDHSGPTDTVQALDWSSGAIQAMLEARRASATSFLYDFHFYHHVSNPYMRDLRTRFLRELDRARPRLIVRLTSTDKIIPTGPDTAQEFPGLEDFIARFYRSAATGEGWIIYERMPDPLASAAASSTMAATASATSRPGPTPAPTGDRR